MSDRSESIKAIFGVEPMRAGEYPSAFQVGHRLGGQAKDVTSIVYRQDNLGTYGIGWFDVFIGDAIAISVQAREVGEVHYDHEGT